MPTFDPFVALGGALTGLVVGMTGMGGGALMTPILVLLFGVNPLTAVSSDIGSEASCAFNTVTLPFSNSCSSPSK